MGLWANLAGVAKSAAERKREQRQRAKEAGLCVVCCIRKAWKGRATCKPCYESAKDRLYAKRERDRED